MNQGLLKRFGLVLIIVAIAFVSNVDGKTRSERRLPRDARATAVAMITGECAVPSRFPKAKLGKLVTHTLRHIKDPGQLWGDRAFPYDLNGDKKPEYLVPLDCSAVGNCTWGVYALNPARLLGVIYGEVLYPRKPTGNWGAISTCSHVSASDCALMTFCFRHSQYTECSRYYLVSAYEHNEPKFMKRLNPTCDPGWHRPARSK